MGALDALTGPGGAGWQDPALAEGWLAGDRLGGLLDLPRRMVAALLGDDGGEVRTVLDVGSGAGDLLAAILDAHPDATGIWADVSETMRAAAEERLAAHGGRVRYRVTDATSVASLAPPGSIDAVVTSRMSHHLTARELTTFYGAAVGLLRPGGWIANLDHVSLPAPWGERLTHLRRRFVAPNPSPHRHDFPHPTVGGHLAALDAAGAVGAGVVWSAFTTVLLVAQSPTRGR